VAVDAQQRELTEVNRRIADVKSNQLRDEAMFNDSRDFVEKKQEEIHNLNKECERLAHDNFKINMRAQQANDLTEDLRDIDLERKKIEEKITRLTSLPFLESNKSGEQAVQHSVARLEL